MHFRAPWLQARMQLAENTTNHHSAPKQASAALKESTRTIREKLLAAEPLHTKRNATDMQGELY